MDLIASTQPRRASHGIDNYSQGSSSRIANAHNRNTSSSKTKNHKIFYRDLLIVAFMCAAVAGGYMFCKDKIASYMLRKKIRIASSVVPYALSIQNVTYSMSDVGADDDIGCGKAILVTGQICNRLSGNAYVNAIEITVSSHGEIVHEWIHVFDYGVILGRDSINFSTDSIIEACLDDDAVDVSIKIIANDK